jgi:serine/threonine protein kinase/tetratricopeptide (TPR) repeat protein
MDPVSAETAAATDQTATMGQAPAEPRRIAAGETFGRYQVLEEIGRGGMGTVYRAFDQRLGRQVALKLVVSSESRRHRLLREAQALAQLAHPNVVSVFDVGVVGDAVFMAMELVEGVSLRHWLTSAPRTPRDILNAFAAAGDGLAAAHAAGLVHRDFKPGNVIVAGDGRIRVVDFGLARVVAAHELETTGISAIATQETSKGDLDASCRSAVPPQTSDPPTPEQIAPRRLGAQPSDGVPVIAPPTPPTAPMATAAPSGAEATAGDGAASVAVDPPDRDASVGSDSGEPSALSTMLESPLTQHGDIVGTPRYMAPEQRRGAATDARTDQFSFGVALYEALYGEHPFSTKAARRRLDEGILDPVDPAHRRGIPAHVRRALVRALQKDPARRFPSMTLLVAELRRDSRLARWKVAIAVGVTAPIAIAAATMIATESEPCAGAAERASVVVRLKGAIGRAVAATGPGHDTQIARLGTQVDGYLAEWVDLRTQTCRATRVHGEQSELVMDRKMACLDDSLDQMSALLRALSASPTDTALNRAPVEIERASTLALCRDAAALARRSQLPVKPGEEDAVEALRETTRQMAALIAVNNVPELEALSRRALDMAQKISHVPTKARALSTYAEAVRLRGQLADNKRALDETLRLAAEADDRTLLALSWSRMLWQIAVEERQLGAAQELIRAAEVALVMTRGEPEHPLLEIEVGHVMAMLRLLDGNLEDAEARYRRVLEQTEAREYPKRRSTTLNNMSIVLIYRGKCDEARQRLASALATYEESVGPNHPFIADSYLNTGLSHHWQGNLADAERWYRQALTHHEQHGGPANKGWLFHLYLGHLLIDRGAWDDAGREIATALDGFAGALGEDAEFTRHARVQRARLRLATGDVAGARADIDVVITSLTRAGSLGRTVPGYTHPRLVDGLVALAEKRTDEAEKALREALAAYRALYGPGGLELADVQIALGAVALTVGRPDQAVTAATGVLALLDAGGSVPTDPRRAEALELRARARAALSPGSEAQAADARAALAIWDVAAPAHPRAAALRAALK